MATTRKIIVEIEAGEKECNDCPMIYYDERNGAICSIWWKSLVADECHPHDIGARTYRLPACLAAEAKLTRLIEAAENAIGELGFNGTFEELAAALKEVKGE